MRKNYRSILLAHIIALMAKLSWIMYGEKVLHKCLIRNRFWIIGNLHHLNMAQITADQLCIRRILRYVLFRAHKPNHGLDIWKPLPDQMLDPPIAPRP